MSQLDWHKLRPHWPFILVAVLGFALVLSGLGRDYLWADEGDTAVLAANITKYGVPKAWDGVTFIDSDKGARLNHDLVMVTSPWLQYYVTAASLLILGKHTLAARLPFAIAGWLTVLLAYRVVLQTTANRWGALCTAIILVGSVQFLLYCRQCRYYALSMLLAVALLGIFLKMKSARQCIWFALIAILLFHAHPFGFVPVIALGLLILFSRQFSNQRRWFWTAAPPIVALTAPWAIFSGSGYSESMGGVHTVPQFAGRVVQYFIECASVTPLLGVIILAIIFGFQKLRDARKQILAGSLAAEQTTPNQSEAIIVFTFVTLFLYALTIAAMQPADSLWRIGIRYTTPMFPLIAITAGILTTKIARGRTAFILSLTAIIVFTKFAQLTPWIFWDKKVTSFDGKEVIEAHLPIDPVERFLNTRQQLMFISDLFQENPGTVAKVSAFLNENANREDRIITNYEWEPIYFHTGLAQALKILPDYPIQRAAKAKALPDYVFDVDQARWLIWRAIWEGYQEYSSAEVTRQIADRGGRLEQVAQLPETLWENRENIHFRRFSGGRYLFHAPETFPPVSVFRITWPSDQ